MTLPLMAQERYSHITTFWKGKLFVFGGRTYGSDEEGAILKYCEYFDL